ncbi:MAG: hypothetical protein ABI743_14880, partial [bacterium]
MSRRRENSLQMPSTALGFLKNTQQACLACSCRACSALNTAVHATHQEAKQALQLQVPVVGSFF